MKSLLTAPVGTPPNCHIVPLLRIAAMPEILLEVEATIRVVMKEPGYSTGVLQLVEVPPNESRVSWSVELFKF